MEQQEINNIKVRCKKATPGPWMWRINGNTVKSHAVTTDTGHGIQKIICASISSKTEDADFIAHSREDIPALLAEVERLNAENADLKAVVDPVKLAEIAMMLIGFKKLQEKQMPKMVVFPTKNYSNLPVAQCPVCGSKKIGNKYCDDCGQALKWEE